MQKYASPGRAKKINLCVLCGEKKDLHLTGSVHADEFYISTPTYPHSKDWTFSLANGLRNKFNAVRME